MVSDTGLIVTSIIGLMGMVLMFIINNSNWFKRENFKLHKSNILNENKIKLERLRKELGLQKGGVQTQKSDETVGVLDLLKGLDRDKIGGILELLQGNDEEEPVEREEGILGLIDKLPPEALQGIIEKLGLGGKNENETGQKYFE